VMRYITLMSSRIYQRPLLGLAGGPSAIRFTPQPCVFGDALSAACSCAVLGDKLPLYRIAGKRTG
jgi:hypothetical protein